MKKRILMIEGNFDGTVGGSHKIQADLATRLSDRFEPVMMYYEDNVWADRMKEAGLEVHCWDDIVGREQEKYRTGNRLGTLFALMGAIRTRRRFIREQKIDLVHLNNTPLLGYDDWLPACRLMGTPIVAYSMGIPRLAKGILRGRAHTSMDACIAISEAVADGIRLNGVGDDRLVFAYPGIDCDAIEAEERRPREEVFREFSVDPGKLLAVMVGNIRHWKGQHVVVEALAGLSQETRDRLHVLFVGDLGKDHIEYSAGLDEAVEKHGIGGMLTFTGNRNDVPDLLEAGDIAIHASVIPEPFGLVVLEAMIHGCAPIAANSGGPVEMLDETSGLVFDPAEPAQLTAHLERLVAEPETRESFARRAKERARLFDLSEHVRVVEECYDRFL